MTKDQMLQKIVYSESLDAAVAALIEYVLGKKALIDANIAAEAAKISTLIGSDTAKSVRTIANEELAAQLIPASAQESLDTLQEIAAWIQEHPGDAATMNQAISDLAALVGTLPSTTTATTVVGYITAEIAALAQQIAGIPGVRQVSRLSLSKETADKALSCVYYIGVLLILFSGALELIVIYNLTSINLAERSREIATVEVLGFYPKETDSYVLRENLILSLIASFIGLPLGMLFHRAVMSRILVDNMVFLTRIRSVSYILAVLITNLFAYMVNLLMRKRIRAIPMAESLKAVE